jgi:hypothetical protein
MKQVSRSDQDPNTVKNLDPSRSGSQTLRIIFLYCTGTGTIKNICKNKRITILILPGARDVGDAVNWFQENSIGEPHLRYPESADNMGPTTIICLFKRSSLHVVIKLYLLYITIYEYTVL